MHWKLTQQSSEVALLPADGLTGLSSSEWLFTSKGVYSKSKFGHRLLTLSISHLLAFCLGTTQTKRSTSWSRICQQTKLRMGNFCHSRSFYPSMLRFNETWERRGVFREGSTLKRASFLGAAPWEFSILSMENRVKLLWHKRKVFKFGRRKWEVKGDEVLSSSLARRMFQWAHLHGDISRCESLCLSFTAASRLPDPGRNGLP